MRKGRAMKVTLTKPFRYWRHGYTPEDYPAGEAEMDEEVALCAEQCGCIAQSAKKPEPPKDKKTEE